MITGNTAGHLLEWQSWRLSAASGNLLPALLIHFRKLVVVVMLCFGDVSARVCGDGDGVFWCCVC